MDETECQRDGTRYFRLLSNGRRHVGNGFLKSSRKDPFVVILTCGCSSEIS